MKPYELTILYQPELENKLEDALTATRNLIESVGGKITKEENEGKKRLAYSIMGKEYAVYYYFDIELPEPSNEHASEISRTLNVADQVLRYLLVVCDRR